MTQCQISAASRRSCASARAGAARSWPQQAAYVATLEPDFEKLSDDELAAKTVEFKQRIENGEDLEDVLFEAYAAVREAFKRVEGIRLFDVQVMGGIVLHEGDIAEMKTGEGKTFVAAQPLYLNSLPGNNVHLVTVNDYLAKRDAGWVGPVYETLGIRAAFIENMMPQAARHEAYAAEITYGTNSEFGFDYLRDNMAVRLEDTVQRGHNYAIVDEVDSILIDEARTPLIISGEPEVAAEVYYDFARIVKRSRDGRPRRAASARAWTSSPRRARTTSTTRSTRPSRRASRRSRSVERALGIDNLYDPRNVQLVNHLNQALRAQALFQRDVDYVVQDGEVKIVDEFTGRIMEGRRWSEGLHQAVEAKEGMRIQEEHVTLATITLQNYFRLYEKLGGMTGTAKTEEKEFVEIYGLNVVEIPTNQDVARADNNDLIFKTKDAKFAAVIEDLAERHEIGQPVLVGTIDVETSEYLSQLLQRRGVPHNVLNAKEHAREAEIIQDAGQTGSVTIATNMAGRGVDIKIDDEVRELGGLYVLGTERHEARRIDNQLRGRSGRQGDPGESRFYLSGQDQVVRLFAGDRIFNIMNRFKLPDDQPMEAKILSNQIENAQKKVEEQNFVMRKNVLKYDDVLNVQRQVIYEQRRQVLEGLDLSEDVRGWIDEVIERVVAQYTESEVARRLGSRRARRRHGRPVRLRHHAGRAARGGRRPALARGARRGVRRGRQGRLRRQGGGVRLGRRGPAAHARARALRDPPGRRHSLARAPREHGLPARGRAPPRHGPEGSARRVPGRGPHDVRGARLRHPRGGREPPVPRADRADRRRSGPGGAKRRPPARCRTSTSRSPAPTRSPRPGSAARRWRPRRWPGTSAATAAARSPRSRSSAWSPRSRSWGATTPAGAARARSTRSATALRPRGNPPAAAFALAPFAGKPAASRVRHDDFRGSR